MINYSKLPQRVRRITKIYDYCIENVVAHRDKTVSFELKAGYKAKENYSAITTGDMEEAIYFLKGVTKPSTREIKVALYSFSCPICGKAVAKGNNFADLGGLRICLYCNVQD
jgi:hypothetical protein